MDDESPEADGPAYLRALVGGFSAQARGGVILAIEAVHAVADRPGRAERQRDEWRRLAGLWRDRAAATEAEHAERVRATEIAACDFRARFARHNPGVARG